MRVFHNVSFTLKYRNAVRVRDRENEDVQCYPAVTRHGNLKEEENGNDEAEFEQRDQNEENDIQKVFF